MPFKSRAQKEYLRINEPEIYERWMRDYDAESFTPPASAVSAAKKGLSQRKKWGRGGLSPADAKSQGIDSGVTRARKISSGKVSRHDVRRMSAFNRHRKNNNPSKKMPDGGPTAGTIAWNLWGGTSGVNWAKKKSAAMNAEDFETMCRQCKIGNYESCLYGETVDTGGFWLSNCVPDPSMNAETFEAHACDCSNSYRYRFDRDLTAVECDRCGGYLDAHKYKVPSAGVVKYAEKYYEEDPERYYSSQFEPFDSFPTKSSAEQLYVKTIDFITSWVEGWDDYRRENQVTDGYFTSLNAAKEDANMEARVWQGDGFFIFPASGDSSGIRISCQKSKESVFNANTMVTKKDYTERIEIKYELIEKMGAETFESPVSCKICGKTFDSFRGLNGHMNAHLPSHRKRAEDEEEEELNKYMVSVPVLHHYTVGPVEAYDEEEAAEDVRENWSEWRRTIDNNGDWGGPMWRYLPWYDADPEAYEVFDSETFEAPLPPICRDCCLAEAGPHQLDPTGETRICIICTFHKKYKLGAENSDGQLAQALARARAKSQEPRRPLKITKLPHRDQTSLKDFEAESNTPLFTKESKVFAIGLASGIVATIFGNLLSEFVIDRYREDPELLDTEQNA